MKKLIGLLVVVVVSGICVPAMAQVEKSIILFRSMDDPEIAPDPDVIARSGLPAPIIPLGYSTWSLQSSASGGEVVIEKIKETGGGTLVAQVTDPSFPVGGIAPAYTEIELGDLYLVLTGECKVTINPLSVGEIGPLFLTCSMTVDTDNELTTPGIRWGQASSNSNFLPTGVVIPGFETGSFWSVMLIWENE